MVMNTFLYLLATIVLLTKRIRDVTLKGIELFSSSANTFSHFVVMLSPVIPVSPLYKAILMSS